MADVLSCSLVNALHAEISVDFSTLVATQRFNNPDMTSYVHSSTGLCLQQVPFGDASKSLCNMSTGHLHLIMPCACRCQVFDTIHGLAHPSICCD